MEKAILFFNINAGKKNIFNKVLKIKKALSDTFNVDLFSYTKIEDIAKILLRRKYSYLFLCGGDGSFNNLINFIMKNELIDFPCIGYIPTGTLNDCLKGYGIKSISSSIKIIKNNYQENILLGKCNDQYFSYLFALGAYSDISYITKRKDKKNEGKISYYFKSIKEAFEKQNYSFLINNKLYESPFVMYLNGSNVGGFKINKQFLNDKKGRFYITRNGIFNGLLTYLDKKNRTILDGNKFTIKTAKNVPCCLDGEKYISNQFEISFVESRFKILVK